MELPKVIQIKVVGDACTGKTSLIERYVTGKPSISVFMYPGGHFSEVRQVSYWGRYISGVSEEVRNALNAITSINHQCIEKIATKYSLRKKR